MDEEKFQQRFMDQIKGKKKVEKKSIGVYKYLVHHSFFDVIVDAYPEFYKIVKEKKLEKDFEKSIFEFMQTSAFSPYIWEMPNEYRKYLRTSEFFKSIPYLNDLLYFEYSELFIFMQKKPKTKKHEFSTTKKYKLSKSANIHRYHCDVINKKYKDKKKLYLLGYFDFELEEVVYRPLDKLLYSFLKTLNKEDNLRVNLRIFLKKNKLAYKDYAKDFNKALEELFDKKVLV